jgi:hypothetical protein
MKKILIPFNSDHFSMAAFEFATKLNELHPVLLTGVFLAQDELANIQSYAYAEGGPFNLLVEKDSNERTLIKQNIQKFEKLCTNHNIRHSVHKDIYNFDLPELKKESGFADLVIIDREVFYTRSGDESPNDYLETALHAVRCPVIVIPEKFKFPERNILAYNGTDDSVYAIKQFAYLFPELVHNETILIYSNDNEKEDIPHNVLIEELGTSHFPNFTSLKLDVDLKNYFSKWQEDDVYFILISGSYGRSPLSQLFKKSFIKDIIGIHKFPVFIAHK